MAYPKISVDQLLAIALSHSDSIIVNERIACLVVEQRLIFLILPSNAARTLLLRKMHS